VLTVAIPVGIFLGLIYALYYYLVRRFDPYHVALLLATAAVMVLAVIAAFSGIDMAVCLIILMFAPVSPSSAMKCVGTGIRKLFSRKRIARRRIDWPRP